MKVGTLLRDIATESTGVVKEYSNGTVTLYWNKNDMEESFPIEDFNKWVAGGFIKVLEIKEKSNEQKPNIKKNKKSTKIKTKKKAKKYKQSSKKKGK